MINTQVYLKDKIIKKGRISEANQTFLLIELPYQDHEIILHFNVKTELASRLVKIEKDRILRSKKDFSFNRTPLSGS